MPGTLEERFRLLTRDMDLEPDQETGCPEPPRNLGGWPVYQAAVGGRRIPLLKILQSSFCELDCLYCPFRRGRDFPRAALRPEELARATQALYRRGHIRGLFLSSGITGGGAATQERLLRTVRLLRQQGFPGYIHLKLMPGATPEQVHEAVALADRVSVNLEAPGARFLSRIAPRKLYWKELLQPLRLAAQARQQREQAALRAASLSTQLVVGPAGERDRDLLHLAEQLLREFGVQRVYFSPFRPIPDTPLEHHPATPWRRAQRLYQAFFLLRDYGFACEELPFDPSGNLPLDEDPKTAWARRHLSHQPVEVNRAPLEQLVRVPGIGPHSARRIVEARRERRLRDLRQLEALGVDVARAAAFLLLDGRRPPRQLALEWGEG